MAPTVSPVSMDAAPSGSMDAPMTHPMADTMVTSDMLGGVPAAIESHDI